MKVSEKIVLFIVLFYCVLHVLVLFQLIPYNMVWGGKIESIDTIYVLEGLAFAIMSFLGVVLVMKNRIVEPMFTDKTIRRILLIFAVFFMLNTVGNLLAETVIEKAQAAVTLYLSVTLFNLSKQEKTI